jgi:hypothetical protein
MELRTALFARRRALLLDAGAPTLLFLTDHPLDRWLRRHHVHLRIALGVCAAALAVGWLTGIEGVTAVAGVATSVVATLVMLYLPRSGS